MYDGRRIGLVIPAYNEEGLVGDVIDAVPSFVDRTYVVDDASSDRTWSEINRHAHVPMLERPVAAVADGGTSFARRMVPIRHARRRGRGAAVKTGYRRALADDMEVIAVVDGDGQMDPGILERFLDPVVSGRADYAKGNRLSSAAHRASMSRWRLFGNVVLTGITKIASGYWGMTDPQNGYTAVSARALRSIDLDALYDDYGFLNDMLIRLRAVDARVVDVPMRARYGEEESGIAYSSFVPRLSVLLLRRYLWRLRRTYLTPSESRRAGTYVIGLVIGAVGLGYLGWVTASTPTPGRLLLGGLLLVLGARLVVLAGTGSRGRDIQVGDRIDNPAEEGGA
jgi:glycosyltransferase involved in cell wall biosynthesis